MWFDLGREEKDRVPIPVRAEPPEILRPTGRKCTGQARPTGCDVQVTWRGCAVMAWDTKRGRAPRGCTIEDQGPRGTQSKIERKRTGPRAPGRKLE